MTVQINPATATIDGVTYQIEMGEIKDTYLGFEGHGIFTFILDMSFGGTGQGAGSYNLNASKYVGFFIKHILDVVGIACWEELKGRNVYVLRDEGYNGIIRGFMDKSKNKYIIFSKIYEEADNAIEIDRLSS